MMEKKTIKGSWVAIVTPFKDGNLDKDAFLRLVDLHIEGKTDGLVICGTTGESPNLNLDEKTQLMRWAAERTAGKMPLMLGTGSNSTASTVEMTRRAADLGAQSVLVVVPYYNKPTPEGIEAHYRAAAAATSLPVVLYNVPGRTGVNMTAQTVLRLASVENIVAVKEASGNLVQAMEIISAAPSCFSLLSGEDALNLQLMASGGSGTISVTANVAPRKMKSFVDACLAGDWNKAREIHYSLLDMHKVLFIESNPAPTKAILAMRNLISDELRLPLVPVSEVSRKRISEVARATPD